MEKYAALQNSLGLLAQYGMEGAYTTMLAAARSKRQLRQMHDMMLPPNCRLLREDYLVFEEGWEALYPQPVYPQGHHCAEPNNAVLCNILTSLCLVASRPRRSGAGCGNLTAYYLACFDAGKELVVRPADPSDDWRSRNGHIIFSCGARMGHGYEHFTTKLFGQTFGVGFQTSADKRAMVVRFTIWESELTEPLVYALLMKLPKFCISRRTLSSSPGGFLVDFCYTMETTGLREHLTTEQGTAVAGSCLVAKSEFITEVARRLREMGVPIEKIDPILNIESR